MKGAANSESPLLVEGRDDKELSRAERDWTVARLGGRSSGQLFSDGLDPKTVSRGLLPRVASQRCIITLVCSVIRVRKSTCNTPAVFRFLTSVVPKDPLLSALRSRKVRHLTLTYEQNAHAIWRHRSRSAPLNQRISEAER